MRRLNDHWLSIQLILSNFSCFVFVNISTIKNIADVGIDIMSGKVYRVECQICKKSLQSNYIYKHIEKVHKAKAVRKIDLKCPSCDYEGPSRRELKEHVIQNHNGKKFACNMCQRRFKENGNLKNHIKFTHMGVKDVKCTYCNFTTRQDSNMKEHITALHSNIKTHKCPACDFKSAYARSVKNHIAVIHGTEKIACSLCDHVSTTKGALKYHNRSVHVEKQAKAIHQCPECDHKTHSGKSDLMRHINAIHKGEKPLKCGQCDYATREKQSLKYHVKAVHDKNKDNHCPHCGYKTALPQALQTHIKRVHLKVRDKKCPNCDYASYSQEHLTNHIKNVHEKLKDFICPQCFKAMSSAQSVALHMEAVHENLKVECSICGQGVRARRLKNHMKIRHEK